MNERGGNLRRDIERGGRRKFVAIQPLAQGLAFNEHDGNVVCSIRFADLLE